MDQDTVRDKLLESFDSLDVRDIMEDYFLIPKEDLPKIHFGFIGDPQEKLEDGTDISIYKASKENIDALYSMAVKYLVMADHLRSKFNKAGIEKDRQDIWNALMEIKGESSKMPDYFEGIESVPPYLHSAVLKVAELKRELVNSRKESVREPPKF